MPLKNGGKKIVSHIVKLAKVQVYRLVGFIFFGQGLYKYRPLAYGTGNDKWVTARDWK